MIKNENDHSYFKLFENCRPVRGAKRSIICDLERKTAILIPEDLYNILIDKKKENIGRIKEKYGRENRNIIQEYFEFLLENEMIFLCTKRELELFPELNLKWEVPSIVSNAIIDYSSKSNYSFRFIFSQLSELGCKDLLVRFFENLKIQSKGRKILFQNNPNRSDEPKGKGDARDLIVL